MVFDDPSKVLELCDQMLAQVDFVRQQSRTNAERWRNFSKNVQIHGQLQSQQQISSLINELVCKSNNVIDSIGTLSRELSSMLSPEIVRKMKGAARQQHTLDETDPLAILTSEGPAPTSSTGGESTRVASVSGQYDSLNDLLALCSSGVNSVPPLLEKLKDASILDTSIHISSISSHAATPANTTVLEVKVDRLGTGLISVYEAAEHVYSITDVSLFAVDEDYIMMKSKHEKLRDASSVLFEKCVSRTRSDGDWKRNSMRLLISTIYDVVVACKQLHGASCGHVRSSST